MLASLVCSLLLTADPPTPERPRVQLSDGTTAEFDFAVPLGKPDDLQAALANHPDVQIAEAEVRLAQAKLAKAKLLVAQQHMAAKGRVEQARAVVEQATRDHERVKKLADQKVVSAGELATAARAVAAAKAVLAAAEADLRSVAGAVPPAVKATAVVLNEVYEPIVRTLQAKPAAQASDGPSADKLREALAVNFVLDLPAGATLRVACDGLANAFKPQGLTIRDPGFFSNIGGEYWKPPPAVGPLKGERPVGQWLQVIADAFTDATQLLPVRQERPVGGRWDFYVREYGLVFARADEAPAGAETVGQFLTHTAKAKPATSPATAAVLASLKANLNRPVKFATEVKVSPKEAYKAILKQVGVDVAVEDAAYPDGQTLTLEAGERTADAWLNLLLDRWNAALHRDQRVVIYVREYGLLLLRANEVPPAGAVRLFDGK